MLYHKSKAVKKYLQKKQEYDRRKSELQRLYVELLQLRALAGVDDAIEVYEAPEWVPGQGVTIE